MSAMGVLARLTAYLGNMCAARCTTCIPAKLPRYALMSIGEHSNLALPGNQTGNRRSRATLVIPAIRGGNYTTTFVIHDKKCSKY